jgi:rhodanese-related sulfurtransferase
VDVPEIDIDEAEQRRAQGAALLDVREADEYEDGHVAGAVHIPLGDVPDRLADIPDGDLLVICQMGGRSRKAAEFLINQGRTATNIAGGTGAWIESGRDVITGSAPG